MIVLVRGPNNFHALLNVLGSEDQIPDAIFELSDYFHGDNEPALKDIEYSVLDAQFVLIANTSPVDMDTRDEVVLSAVGGIGSDDFDGDLEPRKWKSMESYVPPSI